VRLFNEGLVCVRVRLAPSVLDECVLYMRENTSVAGSDSLRFPSIAREAVSESRAKIPYA